MYLDSLTGILEIWAESLHAELDSHTADELDTRIEAFIDGKSYRQLSKLKKRRRARPAILDKRNGAVWLLIQRIIF